MPQSGDQGVKPEAEKNWPDIWHGDSPNQNAPGHGVSPFSESGRFKILPQGTQIPLHKPSSFKFKNCKQVQDIATNEAEQDIARNLQLQGNQNKNILILNIRIWIYKIPAPARKLPKYVYEDFIDKKRNCNQERFCTKYLSQNQAYLKYSNIYFQIENFNSIIIYSINLSKLLNEFCQHRRRTLGFDEVPSNESFKNYAVCAIVDQKRYPPGSAWKKQLAKEAASKNALKSLLMEYYDSIGESLKVERLRNMNEEDEKISRDVDHPTRYKPQPKVMQGKIDYNLLQAKKIPDENVKEVFQQVDLSCFEIN